MVPFRHFFFWRGLWSGCLANGVKGELPTLGVHVGEEDFAEAGVERPVLTAGQLPFVSRLAADQHR